MIVGSDTFDLGELPDGQRCALLAACDLLIDQAFEDVGALEAGEHFGDCSMAAWLPPKYLPRYGALFAKQVAVCLIVVAGKLTDRHPHVLACVAEEMALGALIDEAATDLGEAGERDQAAELRAAGEGAFQDMDFELLFDPRWDGIENTEAGARLAMANLRFEDWFRPF